MSEGMHWKFVWNTWSAVGGLLGGLGIALLLQQYAVFPLSLTLLITGGLIGLVLGILLPSLILGFMVMRPMGASE